MEKWQRKTKMVKRTSKHQRHTWEWHEFIGFRTREKDYICRGRLTFAFFRKRQFTFQMEREWFKWRHHHRHRSLYFGGETPYKRVWNGIVAARLKKLNESTNIYVRYARNICWFCCFPSLSLSRSASRFRLTCALQFYAFACLPCLSMLFFRSAI